MINIEFAAAAGTAGVEFYIGGQSGASRVVGNDWRNDAAINRVARYTFTAPAEGTSGISLTFNTGGLSDGSSVPIRFYIGTDPESHVNAWSDSAYTGELTPSDDGKTFTGEAQLLLLPNTTYYLFVFPGSKTYGYYTWYRYGYEIGLTLTLTGGAGIVYVGGVMYQIYVGNSSGGADLRLPYCGNADGGADLIS